MGLWAVVAVLVGTLAAVSSAGARTMTPTGSTPRAPGAPRAPSGPPLVSEVRAGGVLTEAGAEAGPPDGGDPLVENGLGSPLCKASVRELPPSAVSNCRTADFVAGQAPTGNYAFDVNIDTGLLGLGSGAISAAIQDILVMPAWMLLVWVVHVLLVALEWCFTLDLLESPTISVLGHALRETQTSFTQPWLTLGLAVASVLAVYHGLIRRRIAETMGQAVLMLAMTVGGLWVVSDPARTVGALADWADRASLGTFGAVAQGTPSGSVVTLANGMTEVFAMTIEPAWCYMEFGEVAWCHDSSRVDPRLRAAGLAIAKELEHESAAERDQGAAGSAELLRAARTNGQLFLALPANGVQRNSIGAAGSLLRAICQSSSLTACRGPTAAQAEFRTQGGTLSRCMGLALIAGGALGVILTLGFCALRLLEASIMTLLYLLMAPAAVLAPAFGDGGRLAFRSWAGRLFGAAVSKLVYAFMLGAVLLMVRILSNLQALGWWIQWLLISCLWWGAFRHRHRLLGFGALGPLKSTSAVHRPLRRRVADVLVLPTSLLRGAGRAHDLVRPHRLAQEHEPPRPGLVPADLRVAEGPQTAATTRAASGGAEA